MTFMVISANFRAGKPSTKIKLGRFSSLYSFKNVRNEISTIRKIQCSAIRDK